MSRISLRKKVYLSFLLTALLLGVTGYFYNRSTTRYIQTVLQVQEAQRALNQMELVLSLAKDAETGERGYVITRQENFLEPYYAARKELRQELAQLKIVVRSVPFHAARLPQLQALVRTEAAF
ncbi:MAG TPA: CHASE3 domain-containing protein, partial [Hymenobacter sp.]